MPRKNKQELISIQEASSLLGFKTLGRHTPELLSVLQIDFLSEYRLNKVELDPAFRNQLTGKINGHAFNKDQVLNLVKEIKELENGNNGNNGN